MKVLFLDIDGVLNCETTQERLGEEFGVYRRSVEPKPYPAKWNDISAPDARIRRGIGGKPYDANAGFRRNKEMLDRERIDRVVAFPGGNGTANMVKLAKAAGIPVIEVEA